MSWTLTSLPSAQDPNLLKPKHSNATPSKIASVPSGISDILKQYSKPPKEEDIVQHVQEIHKRAYAIQPRPWIATANFLTSSLAFHPQYPTILSRVRHGALFLDIGCGLGQDIRHLVHSGAPSSHLFGMDIEPRLIELGYELFRDRATLETTFIQHTFDDLNIDLTAVEGKVDIIHVSFFLDQWSQHSQLRLCTKIGRMLKPCAGSMVIGTQKGSLRSQQVVGEEVDSCETDWEGMNKMWAHDVESWQGLWDRVGDRTGARWRVEGVLRAREELGIDVGWGDGGDEERLLQFVVTREERIV